MPLFVFATITSITDGSANKLFNVSMNLLIQVLTEGLDAFIHPEDVQDFVEEVLKIKEMELNGVDIDKFTLDYKVEKLKGETKLP